jgi:hypothetical protein
MSRTFTITYDYLCPFARIANETVVDALRDGADWDVRFLPFSLAEAHVEDGEPSVWDRPLGSEGTRGVRAHAWALAVRSLAPERFLEFHTELFAARHADSKDIEDEAVLRGAAAGIGLDPDDIATVIAGGEAMAMLREDHTEAVKRWSVWGVPTFIAGDDAVFVRFMEHSRPDLERVLDLLDWTNVNEFKRTTIPR